MRRCGSVRAAQNLRGAEGRCDSVRVFCEAGVDRAFTASQRISFGWWGRVGVEGKDGGCDGKGALPGREDCGCENDVRGGSGDLMSALTLTLSHSSTSSEASDSSGASRRSQSARAADRPRLGARWRGAAETPLRHSDLRFADSANSIADHTISRMHT